MPRILIVKLSSLGDVVHAMPAVQDMLAAMPGAQIDWVVERAFAPLVARCQGVQRVIPCELRRWSKAVLSPKTRSEWTTFKADLQAQPYDVVLDLQGLTKSAAVARMAVVAPGGVRYAMANRTAGSSYEAPTRWVADVAIRMPAHTHAVRRARLLCAGALGYEMPDLERFGLLALVNTAQAAINSGVSKNPDKGGVALIHGSSRADKCWPDSHWLALGTQLITAGYTLALPHGTAHEEQTAQRLAQALGPQAAVWPRLDLGALTDRLAACAGVIGVDSGLSHIAVALNLPHVQIYNFPTAWRTGPLGQPHQCSVFGQPEPSVDVVWRAWEQVASASSYAGAGPHPRPLPQAGGMNLPQAGGMNLPLAGEGVTHVRLADLSAISGQLSPLPRAGDVNLPRAGDVNLPRAGDVNLPRAGEG